jgi:hypothetical protein
MSNRRYLPFAVRASLGLASALAVAGLVVAGLAVAQPKAPPLRPAPGGRAPLPRYEPCAIEAVVPNTIRSGDAFSITYKSWNSDQCGAVLVNAAGSTFTELSVREAAPNTLTVQYPPALAAGVYRVGLRLKDVREPKTSVPLTVVSGPCLIRSVQPESARPGERVAVVASSVKDCQVKLRHDATGASSSLSLIHLATTTAEFVVPADAKPGPSSVGLHASGEAVRLSAPLEILPPKVDCPSIPLTVTASAFPLPVHSDWLFDTEMGGSPVELHVQAELVHSRGRVWARGSVEMSEIRQGMRQSSYSGAFETVVFDGSKLPPGCEITGISGSVVGDFDLTTEPNRRGNLVYKPDPRFVPNLVASARCVVDTDGDDHGKLGCSEISLRPVTIRTAQRTSNCAPIRLPLPGSSLLWANSVNALFPLSHVAGDTELGRNPVKLSYSVSLLQDARRVTLRTVLEDVEQGGDGTAFKGSRDRELFDVQHDAPGCVVTGLGASVRRSYSASVIIPNDHEDRHRSFALPSDSSQAALVRSSSFQVDRDGDDAGRVGCFTTNLAKEIEIQLAAQ